MMNLKTINLYFVFSTVFSSLLLVGCKQTIDARQLENINGLYYKLNEHDPFTGKVINNIMQKDFTWYHEANCTINYKNGQIDGEFICYSTKEKIKTTEMQFTNNVKDGVEKVWDAANGGLKWSIKWKNGEHDGLEEYYNSENGNIVEKTNWKDNQKVGEEQMWDSTGNVLLKNLVWKDGKKTGFVKSDDYEVNYKDGKLHGPSRIFRVNIKFEDYRDTCLPTFVKKFGMCSYTLVDHSIASEEMYENGELMSRKIEGEEVPADDPATTDFN